VVQAAVYGLAGIGTPMPRPAAPGFIPIFLPVICCIPFRTACYSLEIADFGAAVIGLKLGFA